MIKYVLLLAMCVLAASPALNAQPFVHPGINQQVRDLDHMKTLIRQGKQPWKQAFDSLVTAAAATPVFTAHTHVLRGPYGKPNIGGDDLRKSANQAYSCALLWYITGDHAYAQKAINLLNSWSATLWDLDYNDAKLLAAWTGHLLCNAAEILRYTGAAWPKKEVENFSNMLMTVYYPLLRPYYPEANGNWEGAIIHSMLAIAIFTDNRPVFNNAIKHFKYGTVNGSLFKYIYPNGECQESPRDQGHVQLGLGEFAGAAQVAYTQGIDFFPMAENRIATGFEYTAGYVLGKQPFCYCTLADRSRVLRDDYEYVYRHYAAMGLSLPLVKQAADSMAQKYSLSLLTSVRAPGMIKKIPGIAIRIPGIAYPAGARDSTAATPPVNALVIEPGQPVQESLNEAAASGRILFLKNGIHRLPHTLVVPSGAQLSGQGGKTILFLDPSSGERETMINKDTLLHDVLIRDLVIEASARTDPGPDPNTYRSYRGGYNRGGILFRGNAEGQLTNIRLLRVTVRNATFSGVSISGGTGITVEDCNFNENGAAVPPGPTLLHNLHLLHCNQVSIRQSRLTTSPKGCGIALDHCRDVTIDSCEIARNGSDGILLTESERISITGNLIEAGDRSGIMAEFLRKGNDRVTISHNIIRYNAGHGITSRATSLLLIKNNTLEGNRDSPATDIGPGKIISITR